MGQRRLGRLDSRGSAAVQSATYAGADQTHLAELLSNREGNVSLRSDNLSGVVEYEARIPAYNIAPTDPVLTVISDGQKNHPRFMRWGRPVGARRSTAGTP